MGGRDGTITINSDLQSIEMLYKENISKAQQCRVSTVGERERGMGGDWINREARRGIP